MIRAHKFLTIVVFHVLRSLKLTEQAPEKWCLGDDPFLFGRPRPIFSGAIQVSGEYPKRWCLGFNGEVHPTVESGSNITKQRNPCEAGWFSNNPLCVTGVMKYDQARIKCINPRQMPFKMTVNDH